MTRNASASPQEKAQRKADVIDRTFFVRNSRRATYIRLPLPLEGHSFPANWGKRYVIVGLRQGGFVRIPCSMQQTPDPTEETAMALFQYCIDVGRNIQPGTPSHTIIMSPDDARKYSILGRAAMVAADPSIERLYETGELDDETVLEFATRRYDERHSQSDNGGSDG